MSQEEALRRYSSPFLRHLSFFDRDGDGIIHYGDSLRGNLSVGIDFPVAAVMALGYHVIYGNTRSAVFGPFNPIRIDGVQDRRNMLESVKACELPVPGIARAALAEAARPVSFLDKAHVYGLWALAADEHGLLSPRDVELYQQGIMLYELERRRKDNRDHVLPLHRGGPISVTGHSWFVDKLFGVKVEAFWHLDYLFQKNIQRIIPDCGMEEWDAGFQPARLTPEPEAEASIAQDEKTIRPSPPLRKSIYSHPTRSAWYVNVIPYDVDWPLQFNNISSHLQDVFNKADPPAPFLTIEHVGSTAIPGLAAKPNIDVLVTFADMEALNHAVEALNWEIPKQPPFVKYTQCPNGGGIPGRESFKIYLFEDDPYYAVTPERSVYLIADTAENVPGRCHIRCYRTLRNVLRNSENADLMMEYGQFKLELAQEEFANGFEYAARKNEIVRKILLRGGWTDLEVDEKERISHREWSTDGDEPY